MRPSFLRVAPTATLILAAFAACRSASTPPVTTPAPASAIRTTYPSGNALLAAMRERYDGKWYRTLTFVQKTSRLQADGKWNVQTWYEAMKVPGLLRIDFDPISAGNGVLYARGASPSSGRSGWRRCSSSGR